jgi:hypothetical protein
MSDIRPTLYPPRQPERQAKASIPTEGPPHDLSHLDRMTEHPTRSSYQEDVLQIYPLQLMNTIP